MPRISETTSNVYREPKPALVALVIDEYGIDAAIKRWGESQTVDSLRRIAAKARPGPLREDADDIIETTRRLGSTKLAARELKVSEDTIRRTFDRAGIKIPKLTVQECVRRGVEARRERKAAQMRAIRPVYRKPEQLSLFGGRNG